MQIYASYYNLHIRCCDVQRSGHVIGILAEVQPSYSEYSRLYNRFT